MIRIEKTEVVGWEPAVRGMRNPMNSWDKSDSVVCHCQIDKFADCEMADKGHWPAIKCNDGKYGFCIGMNDMKLMKKLAQAGTDHRKFLRMIVVYCDITAPLYWWKEFDTYKIGTVANSCSTMHKIHAKEFTLEDFSFEHLFFHATDAEDEYMDSGEMLRCTIQLLNYYRKKFLETKEKIYWWQMIQLLPTSYNQKRTVMLNYEVLCNIYKSRKNHKLDEWRELCKWIESLPYSGLITGKEGEADALIAL